MSRLVFETVQNPDGESFDVSTIRTLTGGSTNASDPLGSMSDYENYSAWPFETMVFRSAGNRIGLYHAPYGTEKEAREGHALMVKTVREGLEFGGGVEGPNGEPSITPDEWARRKIMESGRIA